MCDTQFTRLSVAQPAYCNQGLGENDSQIRHCKLPATDRQAGATI